MEESSNERANQKHFSTRNDKDEQDPATVSSGCSPCGNRENGDQRKLRLCSECPAPDEGT